MFTPTVLYEASKGHQHELEQQAAARRQVEEAMANGAEPQQQLRAMLSQQAHGIITRAQEWWDQRPQLEWRRAR